MSKNISVGIVLAFVAILFSHLRFQLSVSRFSAIIELFIFIMFLFFAVFTVFFINVDYKRFLWFSTIFFTANMLNFIVLYFLSGETLLFVFSIVISAAGLLLASTDAKMRRRVAKPKVARKNVPGKSEKVQSKPDVEVYESGANRNVKKVFTPGKYVASKWGNVYHAANSEWASKMKRDNMIFFQTEEEAKKSGRKPHRDLNK